MRSSRPSSPSPHPSSEGRAKRLSHPRAGGDGEGSGTRDPRLSAAAWRELDRYAEAANAFGSACDERSGLGRIDECYGDLVFHAGAVIRALLDDHGRAGRAASRWTSETLAAQLEAYTSGRQTIGDAPERDVQLADVALREARALPVREGSGDARLSPSAGADDAATSDRRAV